MKVRSGALAEEEKRGVASATDRLIVRNAGRHGALRAAVAREGGALDLDLARVRIARPAIASDLGNGVGGSKSREEESDGTHFGC